MAQCRIENISITSHAFVTRNFSEASIIFDLGKLHHQCVENEILTREEADNWWSQSEHASKQGYFFAALNIIETVGAITN